MRVFIAARLSRPLSGRSSVPLQGWARFRRTSSSLVIGSPSWELEGTAVLRVEAIVHAQLLGGSEDLAFGDHGNSRSRPTRSRSECPKLRGTASRFDPSRPVQRSDQSFEEGVAGGESQRVPPALRTSMAGTCR